MSMINKKYEVPELDVELDEEIEIDEDEAYINESQSFEVDPEDEDEESTYDPYDEEDFSDDEY